MENLNPAAFQLTKDVVLYFETTQCPKLRPVSPDESTLDFSEQAATQAGLEKAAHEVYERLIEMIRRVTDRNTGVKVAFATSGEVLQAMVKSFPAIIDRFRELTSLNSVEWLGMPYHNSLSLLFSDEAYREEVIRHRDLLQDIFFVQPGVLLAAPVFDASLVSLASGLGFKAVIMTPEESVKFPISIGTESMIVMSADDGVGKALTRFGGDLKSAVQELVSSINRAPGDTVVICISADHLASHHDNGLLKFLEEFLSLAAGQDRLVHPGEVVSRIRMRDDPQLPQFPGMTSNGTRWLSTDLQREAFMAAKDLDDSTKDLVDTNTRHALMGLLNAGHYASMSSTTADLSGTYLSAQEAFSYYMSALQSLRRIVDASAVKVDDSAAKSVEATRQHTTTPAWALNEQSRYNENTQSHI